MGEKILLSVEREKGALLLPKAVHPKHMAIHLDTYM